MIFLKGKVRFWAILISCLVIGPKILLLFPVWLMGVYLHRSKTLEKLSTMAGWFLFISSSAILILWEYFEVTIQISEYLKIYIGDEFHEKLAFSKYFLGDYILGPLIVLNFAGFRAMGHQLAWLLNPFKKVIRYAASFTLTLYLFHQPLIQFYAALIAGEEGEIGYFWQTIAATMVTIFILGYLTERRREGMRQWLRVKLSGLEKRPLMQRVFNKI